MTGEASAEAYGSLQDFYMAAYAPVVREVRPAGRTGAMMIHAEQDRGDWSDAATPDLSVGVPIGLHAPATIDMGGGRFRVQRAVANAFVVNPPGYANTVLVEGRHAIRVLALPYAKLLGFAGDDAGLPSDGDFGRLHAGFTVCAEVSRLLDGLWAAGRSGSAHGCLWADGLILQIVARLIDLRDRPVAVQTGGLAAWQVRRACDLMQARLAEGVGLDDAAASVGLSPWHFARAFKASVGATPNRWLTERRIDLAKHLLADRRQSLTEVALAVGFGSQSAFGAAFRRVVGLTPGEYRRAL